MNEPNEASWEQNDSQNFSHTTCQSSLNVLEEQFTKEKSFISELYSRLMQAENSLQWAWTIINQNVSNQCFCIARFVRVVSHIIWYINAVHKNLNPTCILRIFSKFTVNFAYFKILKYLTDTDRLNT